MYGASSSLTMNRKWIHSIQKIFTELGIDVSEAPEKKAKIWRLIVGTSIVTCGLSTIIWYLIINFHDSIKCLAAFSNVCAAVVVLCNTFWTFLYRDSISKMFKEMDKNIFTHPNESLLETKYKWFQKEKNFTKIVHMGILIYVICPCVTVLPFCLKVIFYQDINIVLYPAAFPWDCDNLISRFLLCFLQFSATILGLFYWLLPAISLFLAMEFAKQFERIEIALGQMKDAPFDKSSPRYNFMVRKTVINCIKHHQMIYKTFVIFKPWFCATFSGELLGAGIIIPMYLFNILQVTQIVVITVLVVLTMIGYVNLMLKCYIGEKFANMNRHLQNAIFYEVDWVGMNKENRQLCVIFHSLLDRPLQLRGFSIVNCSLVNYAIFVKTSYQWFTAIRISLKHK